MDGIIKTDMAAFGLKKGDVVRVVSTHKRLGRLTIKWESNGITHTETVDAWRVALRLGGYATE